MANRPKSGASAFESLRVWLDGELIPFKEANVPILTHSLQYGSGIFEGIRAYDTGKGAAVFRLGDHVHRFFNSMKMYYISIGYSENEIEAAIKKTVKVNGLSAAYIRPFAFYNDSNIGLSTKGKSISVYIAAVPFNNYFGAGKETGIRCKVASWRRIGYSILPVEAKASGNYINSILASNEAVAAGFDEGILLSHDGYLAEGPGENIFLVRNGKLYTPDDGSDILLGITRDSIIRIAESSGITVVKERLHREALYTADEVFFTGTAAEVTPIVNIDGIKIGDGKPGEMTRKLADRYNRIARGKEPAFSKWLSSV
jgi:branched-chain amino acid aminotransferase